MYVCAKKPLSDFTPALHNSYYTHKFLFDGEVVEQLHTSKVVAGNYCVTTVTQVSSVHICLVSILRPNAEHLITKNTEIKYNEEEE